MTPTPPLDYTQHLYYEKKIQSVTASTRRDGEELLRIAVQIPIHTETQLFSLEEANQALQLLKEGRINGAGVLQVQEE
jgi:propanol-preferring alcohol dehydrogenase